MQAALKAGVERIVYTSSVATLAVSASGESIDETKPLSVDAAIGAYKKSKVVAEQIVAAMVAAERLPAVIVHPSTPIGPRDIKPTPTGRIIVEAACGRMPGYVDTGLNLVHVDDVAEGHIAALQQGRDWRALYSGWSKRGLCRDACRYRGPDAAAGRRGCACRAD